MAICSCWAGEITDVVERLGLAPLDCGLARRNGYSVLLLLAMVYDNLGIRPRRMDQQLVPL
jgi:hypothetical protein